MAIELGWYDTLTFDDQLHDDLSDCYDISIVMPNMMVFSTPIDNGYDPSNNPMLQPSDYSTVLLKYGVQLVVRLSKPMYDSHGLTDHGIDHLDIFIRD